MPIFQTSIKCKCDADLDLDEDGFDVDRDGFVTLNEMLTSSEEYSYNSPGNWTNELDGLRCYALWPGNKAIFFTNGHSYHRIQITQISLTYFLHALEMVPRM